MQEQFGYHLIFGPCVPQQIIIEPSGQLYMVLSLIRLTYRVRQYFNWALLVLTTEYCLLA